jgi:hypothetical protein
MGTDKFRLAYSKMITLYACAYPEGNKKDGLKAHFGTEEEGGFGIGKSDEDLQFDFRSFGIIKKIESARYRAHGNLSGFGLGAQVPNWVSSSCLAPARPAPS